MNNIIPDEMNKIMPDAFGKLVSLALGLMICSKNKCNKQKAKVLADKDISEKYNKFKVEEDKATKLKILGEVYDNTLIYKLNVCITKNCNTLVKDVVKMLKSMLLILPEHGERAQKLKNIIDHIEIIINTPKLTEKKYKEHIKNINIILKTIN